MDEIVVTVAYLPQVIRGYFGDGESLGVKLHYSVEETPLGTAGSVENAEELLDETFLVISGDALCDFDLSELIGRHRERDAVAHHRTAVGRPARVRRGDRRRDGRIERFLEKPSWARCFRTRSTPACMCSNPRCCKRIPRRAVRLHQATVSHAARRGLLAGHRQPRPVPAGQLRRARGQGAAVALGHPGGPERVLGEEVQLPELDQIEGPAYIGNYCKIEAGAESATVLRATTWS